MAKGRDRRMSRKEPFAVSAGFPRLAGAWRGLAKLRPLNILRAKDGRDDAPGNKPSSSCTQELPPKIRPRGNYTGLRRVRTLGFQSRQIRDRRNRFMTPNYTGPFLLTRFPRVAMLGALTGRGGYLGFDLLTCISCAPLGSRASNLSNLT